MKKIPRYVMRYQPKLDDKDLFSIIVEKYNRELCWKKIFKFKSDQIGAIHEAMETICLDYTNGLTEGTFPCDPIVFMDIGTMIILHQENTNCQK